MSSFSSVRYYVDNISNNSSEGELDSSLNSAVKEYYDSTLGSEEELELSLKSVKDYCNASDDMARNIWPSCFWHRCAGYKLNPRRKPCKKNLRKNCKN